MNLQVCKHYIYASFSPTVGPFQTIVFKSADHYLVKQNVGKICNRCPHVGAGGLTSGGMPEEEQFLASLGNDKK